MVHKVMQLITVELVMKRYQNRSKSKVNQEGITLILFVFMLGLAITAFTMKLFSVNNLKAQRNIKSTVALDKAKIAVIANVVTGLSGSGLGQFPCDEDTSLIGLATEGQAKGTCNGTPVLGRFAWRSLNTGDLRDGNSDKIWYALSAGYRAAPVNSDTVPALTVNGVANKAVAIFFSPGTLLPGQSRPLPTGTTPPLVSDYLELENSNGDSVFSLASPSSNFNDQAILIEPDDIYPLLEKRVLKEFKKFLNTYKATWGAFPYPTAFTNPATASYIGNAALISGFLPISNTGATTTWDTTNAVGYTLTNLGTSTVTGICTYRTSNTRIRCDITISGYDSVNPPSISISGVVNNIGLRFYDGFTDISNTTSNDVRITPTNASVIARVMSYSLNSAGQGTITFSGTLTNNGAVRVEFRRTPPLTNWVLAATNHYLLANNWHQLVSYQVASPFLPGGSQTCGVSCLKINRLDVTPNTVQSNIHALLISAGRKLITTNYRPAPTYGASNPAQNRPSAVLADYFDSANNISSGLVFEKVEHPMGKFNDQIEMVE